jgi:hypothetical protein
VNLLESRTWENFDTYDGPGRRVLWATTFVKKMAVWFEGPPQPPRRSADHPRRAAS